MKKKQLIRLTESDLHNIIKESVNNILTELDWRTLASAEEKAHKKAMDAKSDEERLLALNQTYNLKNGKIRKQNDIYDGINSDNFNVQSSYPKSKQKFDDKQDFYQNINTGKEKTSYRKQLGGAAKIAQFNRGEDEYKDGKWRKKQ